MAVNNSRSMNGDLAEGMSDGKFKKIAMDRGGDVGKATWRSRMQLNDKWHGIHEVTPKVLGDSTTHDTPDYVSNPMPPKGR